MLNTDMLNPESTRTEMQAIETDLASQHLFRLLMLSSTALPIGAYCYSQGVESAIEIGLITNEATAQSYFDDVLELVMVRAELPWLRDLVQAAHDHEAFSNLSQRYIAMRESKEFVLESRQLAYSLLEWIKGIPLQLKDDERLPTVEYGFLPMYSWLVHHWQLPLSQALCAHAFAVLENQVLAAIKTLPLGQMSGQRILWKLQQQLPASIARLMQGQQISSSLPHLAVLSAQHEQQYSRLFRS